MGHVLGGMPNLVLDASDDSQARVASRFTGSGVGWRRELVAFGVSEGSPGNP